MEMVSGEWGGVEEGDDEEGEIEKGGSREVARRNCVRGRVGVGHGRTVRHTD